VPGLVKVWSSGSCRVDVVPSSGNVQSQLVGLPPEVSRNVTVNGATPERVDGASMPLPVKAALGAVPEGPLLIALVIPLLTGNTDDADTVTLPPTMFLIPGVMRLKVHDRLTVAESPMSEDEPFPPVSAKAGAGAVWTPPTVGSLQLVAAASLRIWFWYFALTFASPLPCHAVGLFAARFAAMRLMLWRLIQPRYTRPKSRATSVNRRRIGRTIANSTRLWPRRRRWRSMLLVRRRSPVGKRRIWGPAVRIPIGAGRCSA
jgi:hypothetical protein